MRRPPRSRPQQQRDSQPWVSQRQCPWMTGPNNTPRSKSAGRRPGPLAAPVSLAPPPPSTAPAGPDGSPMTPAPAGTRLPRGSAEPKSSRSMAVDRGIQVRPGRTPRISAKLPRLNSAPMMSAKRLSISSARYRGVSLARLKVRHWELTASTPDSSGTSSSSSGGSGSWESAHLRL